MTIVKRGFSQVAKDVKHIGENASKVKGRKIKSGQKANKSPKDSQESSPKKVNQQKRNATDKNSINTGSIGVKKKDTEESKNTPSTPSKSRRDSIDNKGNKKSNIINKKTSDGKFNKKTLNDECKKEELKKIANAQREKFSKDKLQLYVNYITNKIMKDRSSERVDRTRFDHKLTPPKLIRDRPFEGTTRTRADIKLSPPKFTKDRPSEGARNVNELNNSLMVSKITKDKPFGGVAKINADNRSNIIKDKPSEGGGKANSFMSPNGFGSLGYYQSKLREFNKAGSPVSHMRPVSDSPVSTSINPVRKLIGKPSTDKTKKVSSKHSRHSRRGSGSKRNQGEISPTKLKEIAKSYANANKSIINPPPIILEKVDNTSVKEKSSYSKYLSSPASSHKSSRTPLKVGSFTLNLNLQERTSSKYKRLKYQTGEELLKFYKDRVEKAMKERKTFTVCGNFWSVRKALLARGWVEKIHYAFSHPDRDMMKKLLGQNLNELIEGVSDKAYGPLYKRVIMSKMLGRHQVDLFWDYGCDPYKVNPDNVKLTIINHIRRGYASYSSKEGLCEIMKRSHWYHFPGLSNIRHPRSYTLTDNGDPEEFIKDFRITAAMSLLKWIATTTDNSPGKVMSDAGKVPIKYFHFALNECEKHVQEIRHDDIDVEIPQPAEYEWNGFLENYYRCVHIGNHFKSTDEETEQSMIHKSKIMINKLKRYCSCIDWDGYMNIWILKPTAGSRGIGIHICRTLSYVLRVVSERKTIKYVIQKYIERPLLIYNTKFDIRQWFLISSTNPLTIWMYKMCYLRFSSQTYNLRKLHESIHLTNNSVQCKYRNVNRDPGLPDHNMWDSNRFKTYLESIGFPNAYDAIIYPGMKQCLTAAVLISQENINTRKNCFELYGADFMLTEDFQPWLIEINSRPALYASTPVTGRMCPQVLEDVVKVIIDYPRNAKANTGHFDLAYKEQPTALPVVDGSSLVIRGMSLTPSYFVSPSTSAMMDAAGNKLQAKSSSVDLINFNNDKHYMLYASEQLKRTLKTLLDVIAKERERRRNKRLAATNTATRKSAAAITDAGDIPYAVAITNVNDELKEIQEIFRPRHLTDKKLGNLVKALYVRNDGSDISTTSSDSSIQELSACTETDSEPILEDKSGITSKTVLLPDITYKLSKEEQDAINEYKDKLERTNGRDSNDDNTTRSGFLMEMHDYFAYWKSFARGKMISSAPTSPGDSKEKIKNEIKRTVGPGKKLDPDKI